MRILVKNQIRKKGRNKKRFHVERVKYVFFKIVTNEVEAVIEIS